AAMNSNDSAREAQALSLFWMRLPIGDFLRDTNGLLPEEFQAFTLLMIELFERGKLPDDDRRLCALAKLGMTEWSGARVNVLNRIAAARERIAKTRNSALKRHGQLVEASRKGVEARRKVDHMVDQAVDHMVNQ